MVSEWQRIEGCPVGEMTPGSEFECLVAIGGRVTIGTYREGLFGDWRWVDPRGRKIEPQWFSELPQPPEEPQYLERAGAITRL